MMWNGSMWGWDGWAVMGGAMALLLLPTSILVFWAVAWAARSSTVHRDYETARDALDRRLATGEISQEDYTSARHLIEDRTPN